MFLNIRYLNLFCRKKIKTNFDLRRAFGAAFFCLKIGKFFVSLKLRGGAANLLIETVLIKYDCALCIRIVKSLSDVAKLEPLLSMKGNRDFFLMYEKKWRLFLFDV